MSIRISRRQFVEALGALGVAGAFPAPALAQPEQSQTGAVGTWPSSAPGLQAATGQKSLGTLEEGYSYLTDPEIAFIEAAIDRFIPSDDLGPGALESGVAYFIDQQLSGSLGYGYAGTWYMQGPFAEGTATQGYQLPLNPQQLYRVGIAATNRYCQANYQNDFAKLTGDQQEEVLKALQDGHAPRCRKCPERLLPDAIRQHNGGFLRRPDLRRQPR